jgi:hypothetical protein
MKAAAPIVVVTYLSIGVALGAVLTRSRQPWRAARVGRVLRFAPMWGYWAFRFGPMLWRHSRAILRPPGPGGMDAWKTAVGQANQRFMGEVLAVHVRRCPICKVGWENCEAATAMQRFIVARGFRP